MIRLQYLGRAPQLKLKPNTHDIFHGVGIVCCCFFFFFYASHGINYMLKLQISFFAIFGLKKVFTLGSFILIFITLTTFFPKSPNMKHSCERVSSNLLTFEGDRFRHAYPQNQISGTFHEQKLKFQEQTTT